MNSPTSEWPIDGQLALRDVRLGWLTPPSQGLPLHRNSDARLPLGGSFWGNKRLDATP